MRVQDSGFEVKGLGLIGKRAKGARSIAEGLGSRVEAVKA